jgi:hypothetical protein
MSSRIAAIRKREELSFASYVQASVLTANLLTLARHLLA